MIVLRRTHEALRAEMLSERERFAKALAAELERRFAAEGRLAAAERETTWLREQLTAKDEAMLALRREGFDPAGVPGLVPQVVKLPGDDLGPEVKNALQYVAKPGDPLWFIEVEAARRELSAGRSAEQVAQSIRRGSTLNPFE